MDGFLTFLKILSLCSVLCVILILPFVLTASGHYMKWADKYVRYKQFNSDTCILFIVFGLLGLFVFLAALLPMLGTKLDGGDMFVVIFSPIVAIVENYCCLKTQIKEAEKNILGVTEEVGEIIIKSGSGQIHYNAKTGKPIGGAGYDPDDWRDRPEFIGKNSAELAKMINGYKVKNYNEIKEKVEYWKKISENLEDELMSLDLDNIDLELVKGIWEAFWLRWSLPSYSSSKKDVCFDASDIFMEIEQAIEDGTWENNKAELRMKVDELKLQLCSYDLSVPTEEHKEAFQDRLRELTY